MNYGNYFKDRSLLKMPGVGVHYEQKTTPDLIWCVALTIINFVGAGHNKIFSDHDIRNSQVFTSMMADYFSKPPQQTAPREYDKISRYQLELLAFAGILTRVGVRPSRYQIAEIEIIKDLATSDFSASKFLTEYTEKFLRDNGLWPVFEQYLSQPNQDNYEKAKLAYLEWARLNTAVRGADPKHSYRVFNKIFNVICYKYGKPGQYLSRVISGRTPYSYLIYNRRNFRDTDMPPGMTRQQYHDEVLSNINETGVKEALLTAAKGAISTKYGDSEIKDSGFGYVPDSGIHVHHILPRSSYPQFLLSKENLIALTPGQHLSRAHVRANTRLIDPEFQIVCLYAKLDHIAKSIDNGEDFYDYGVFVSVVNTALGLKLPNDKDLEELRNILKEHYSPAES